MSTAFTISTKTKQYEQSDEIKRRQNKGIIDSDQVKSNISERNN